MFQPTTDDPSEERGTSSPPRKTNITALLQEWREELVHGCPPMVVSLRSARAGVVRVDVRPAAPLAASNLLLEATFFVLHGSTTTASAAGAASSLWGCTLPLRRRERRRRRGLAREGPRRRSVVNDKGSLESDSVSQAGVDNDGAEPTEVAELPEGGGAEGEAEDEEDQKAERPVPLLEQPLVIEGPRKWLLATTCTRRNYANALDPRPY